MKKIIVVLIMLMLVMLSSFAATVMVEPFYGISGLPVGSNYYKGGDGWISANKKYTDIATNSSDAKNNDFTVTESYIKDGTNKYTDIEMVGLISISDGNGISTPIEISISAPNGLYMASQSQPSYKRPIEIWFYPSFGDGVYKTQLSESNPTVTLLSDNTERSKYSSTKTFHFDVVLVMPGELKKDTNEIYVKETGLYYPLVDAEDYSCLLTITVTYGGTTQTCTIPFTGYYNSKETGQQVKKNSGVSMNVELSSKAYNLNLDTDQGSWIDIGSIAYNGTYMNNTQTYWWLTSDTSAVIFFSSSSDPFEQGKSFKMVKDDLSQSSSLTSTNSLGFKLRVSSPSGTGSGASYSTTYLEYDGTLYVDETLKNKTSSYVSSYVEKGFIVPDKVSATFVSGQGTKYWYEYSSRIEVQLEKTSATLLAGRYTGDIYVHVMILE